MPEEILFSNIIEYKSKGTDDVLSSAGEIDAMLERLSEGVEISVDVDIPDVDVSELEGLNDEVFTPTISPELDTEAIETFEAVNDTSVEPDIEPALDDEPITEVEAVDTLEVEPDIEPSLNEEPVETVTDLDGTTVEPDIEPVLDDTEVQSLLDLDSEVLEPSIDPTLDSDDRDLATLLALNETALQPLIDPELDDRDGTLTTLDEWNKRKIEPEVEAKETDKSKEELASIKGRLDALLALKAIDIAMNVAGNILDVLNRLERFTLDPILNLDDSLARVSANTRGLDTRLADVGDTITRLRYDSEASFDTVSGVVIELARQTDLSGQEFEDAALAILKFKNVFGANEISVLGDTANIVGAGLADTFEEALDIVATGYQIGGDRAGDFTKVLAANSNALKELGLTGEEAMAFIASGLDAGFISATQAGNALEIFNQELAKAAADPRSDASALLRRMGLQNPKKKGGEVGAEFIESVLDGIRNLPEAKQAEAVSAFFGAKALKKGITPFLDGVTTAFEELGQGDIGGTLESAFQASEDTIRGTVEDLFLLAEQLGQKVMDELGVDEFLQDLKTGLQEMMALLGEGATLGEALEKGLRIEGADEFIQRFESSLGNFIIGILEAVARIQELTGGDSTSTRTEIARLGESQFAFDMKVANEDEIAGIVKTAVDRGVEASALGKQASTAIDELLVEGQVAKAQAILNQLRESGSFVLSPEIDLSTIEGMASKRLFDTAVAEQNIELLREMAEDGMVISPDLDLAVAQGKIDILTTQMREQFDQALATGDIDLATRIAEQLGDEDLLAQAEVAAEALEEMKEQVLDASDTAQTAMDDAANAIGDDFLEIGKAAQQADDDVSDAISGNSIVPEFQKLQSTADASLPAVDAHMKRLASSAKLHLSIVSSWSRIAVDSMMKFGDVLPILEALVTKLGQASAAASSTTAAVNSVSVASPLQTAGVANNTTNNSSSAFHLNQQFNVQSQAQAMSAAQQTANSVRGF